MLSDAEREELRDDVEAELPDHCRVVRRVRGPFDPATGLHGDPQDTLLFEGPCRAMPWTGGTGRPVVGEEAITKRSYDVTLPVEAAGIRSGDFVIVTASPDPDLEGAEMVVRDVAAASLGVQRRLVAEREE